MSAQEHIPFEPPEHSAEIVTFPEQETPTEWLKKVGGAIIAMAKAAFSDNID